MPSRYRARLQTLQHAVLDDFFEEPEIDLAPDEVYLEEEDEEEEVDLDDDPGLEEGGSEEQEEDDDGQGSSEDEEEEEEERDREEFAVRDCGPPARARVSGAAAASASASGAAERANTPTCPVCMEPWTSEGAHRISCIPCGHVYGRSCLERWLTQRGNRSATCPQCGKRFKQKDIINLYAPEVAIPHSELEKEISSLREKNDFLEEKVYRDKLVQGAYRDEMIRRNGPDCDWRHMPIDADAVHASGGGKAHGRFSLFDGVINTRDVTSSRRSASSSQRSSASCRRPTEQELEIARLREENRQRDEQLKAQSEYYARAHEQQQQLLQLLAQQQGIAWVPPPPPPQWTFVPMGPPPPPGHVLTPPQYSTPPAVLPAPGSQADDGQGAGSATARGWADSLFHYEDPAGGSGSAHGSNQAAGGNEP